MSSKIFKSILMAAGVVLLASLLIIMGCMYEYFGGVQENQMQDELNLAAAAVEDSGASYLEKVNGGHYRLTWIGTDGTVLYDSKADQDSMENHLQRDEVQQALETGEGQSSRYSKTLMEKTLYRALRLSDGSVLRISINQATVWLLALGMLRPILVVLAAAIEPDKSARPLATMLTASMDTNDFFTEAHAKLRPVESPTAGIYLSGACQGPKDIPDTVAQAGAAASKVIGLLAKDKLKTNPCTAKPDELRCNGCSQCANVCPYGAISYENRQVNDHGIREERHVAVVNSALCQGCGACTVTCPSGAIYKREEDGIVLIDQDKCRGWRLCISGCPYKKIYFNWKSGKSEKCIFCYPRIESGQPTVCSETCVGRIRYLGVLLYDADRIEEAASTEREVDLYERQCEVFLDPHDPSVIEEALKQGIPQNVIDAAQRSPVYKMAMDWKLALPLHPEYRTLPMVWYVPPLSPIQSYADAGGLPKSEGMLPAIESLRIPVQYLANMLSAGDTGPVLRALKRMMAMRHYMRSQTVEGVTDTRAIDEVGLSVAQVEEMYRYLAIANYEDRFVIPTSHREMAGDAFAERNGCGFTFGDGCHGSDSKFNLFNSSRIDAINITEVRDKAEGE